MKKLLTFLTAGLILAGCSADTGNESQSSAVSDEAVSSTAVASSEAKETVAVTITISVDGKEIEDGTQQLEVEPDMNLLEVMKENYDIEEENAFITSINGHKQDEEAGKYWLFDINGEMAPAGANDTKLQEGDTVEWKLEAIS